VINHYFLNNLVVELTHLDSKKYAMFYFFFKESMWCTNWIAT